MKTKYSVVYAITSPTIGDRISLGIVVIGDKHSSFYYSNEKLIIASKLVDSKSAEFLKNSIENFSANVLKNNVKEEVERKIGYLSRYSNNLICMTSIKEIDIEYNDSIPNWLFKRHVDDVNAMKAL